MMWMERRPDRCTRAVTMHHCCSVVRMCIIISIPVPLSPRLNPIYNTIIDPLCWGCEPQTKRRFVNFIPEIDYGVTAIDLLL